MQFQKLELDPAANPAVLDTATWDRGAAAKALTAMPTVTLQSLGSALWAEGALSGPAGITLYSPSRAIHEDCAYGLASLGDGQQVFLCGGRADASPLGEPFAVLELPSGGSIAAYPTDAPIIHRYLRQLKPDSGPQALGPVPRLGIGTRMTTAVWPAIWTAMARFGFAANAIQNSVRELHLLPNLLAAAQPEVNVAFNFGAIETGYTGSTFEGLWVAGVLDGLQHGAPANHGADADHIQVKRGPGGLNRAKTLLDAARYYSFYTLDVSDVLNYGALDAGPAAAEAMLAEIVPDAAERRMLLAYHRETDAGGGAAARLDETMLARLAGKYWDALEAMERLTDYLKGLRQGEPFDLELSIDEHPGEVATFDCLTSEMELIFLLNEARRRGIPLTHIAPNLGIEKGVDYACPDGLPGLAMRCASLARLAADAGTIMDVHSGDDLSAATRQAVGRAAGGFLQFKVSPMLQLIFAEVLTEHDPELFRLWWEDALVYARRAAEGGSALAVEALRHDSAGAAGLQPTARGAIFHHFSFAFVGRRDAAGRFLVRDRFYRLTPDFYRAYQEHIVAYLGRLAADLF